MSDAGWQLARSVVNLGLTIQGRIDQAEQASQYTAGAELLTRGLNQFDLNLQTDPNWQEYPKKSAQVEQDLWNQADKIVTNPTAKNRLYEWWTQQTASHMYSVGDAQIKRRAKDILGTAQEQTDALLSDTSVIPEDAKKKLRDYWQPVSDIGAVSPQELEGNLASWDHDIDLSSVENGAFQAMRQPDGSLDYEQGHAFLAEPSNIPQGVSLQEVQQISGRIDTMQKEADAKNVRDDKIRAQDLENMNADVVSGKKSLAEVKEQWFATVGQFSSVDAQQLGYDWTQRYKSLLDWEAQGGKVPPSDDSVRRQDEAEAWFVRMHQELLPDFRSKITKHMVSDKSLNVTDARQIMADATAPLDPFVGQIASDGAKNSADPSAYRSLFGKGESNFRATTGRDMTTEEALKLDQSIQDQIATRVTADALKTFFQSTHVTGENIPILGGAIKGARPEQQWQLMMSKMKRGAPTDAAPLGSLSEVDMAFIQGDPQIVKDVGQLHQTLKTQFQNEGLGPIKKTVENYAQIFFQTQDNTIWRYSYDEETEQTVLEYLSPDGKSWIPKNE